MDSTLYDHMVSTLYAHMVSSLYAHMVSILYAFQMLFIYNLMFQSHIIDYLFLSIFFATVFIILHSCSLY